MIKFYLRSQFTVPITKEYNTKRRYEYNALKTYSLEKTITTTLFYNNNYYFYYKLYK